MGEIVRVAIVGCGVIGRVQAWSFASLENARVHVLIDQDAQRAEQLSADIEQLFGDRAGFVPPRIATSMEEAWLADDVDAVSIALPHDLHRRAFEACVNAQRPVMCEKPYATTIQDLRAMHQLSLHPAVPTMGVFQHRYAPLVQFLRHAIRSGQFGRITRAEVDFACYRGEAYYDSENWRGSWTREGGSLLINQAIHTIDLLTYLLGQAAWVKGRVERRWVPNIETEDWAEGQVGFLKQGHEWLAPDLVAQINAVNRMGNDWSPALHITGDEAAISILGSDTVTSISGGTELLHTELQAVLSRDLNLPRLPGKNDYSDLHTLQIRDFVHSVASPTHQPLFQLHDATDTNELVLAFYTASETGNRQNLPLSEQRRPILR